jgi:hypothetical protein
MQFLIYKLVLQNGRPDAKDPDPATIRITHAGYQSIVLPSTSLTFSRLRDSESENLLDLLKIYLGYALNSTDHHMLRSARFQFYLNATLAKLLDIGACGASTYDFSSWNPNYKIHI